MELQLADNIRRLRRERSLTQEQLAEVLGVTVGAVYKWEARLSLPELGLIVEMADFFDTSVDVLLGYRMKDNRPDMCLQRLKRYRHEKDPAGPAEAEKALKKYPHMFDIVHESAILYRLAGIERENRDYLRRSLELLEESMLLLSQNTDPEIGEASLYGEMAQVYLTLDETDRAIDLLKEHNTNGMYSDLIGLAMTYAGGRDGEAVTFLSSALLQNVSSLIQTVSGYVNVYEARGDNASARSILLWMTGLLSGLRDGDKSSFLDKVNAVFFCELADTQLRCGDPDGARSALRKARELAMCFDADPDYGAEAVRFAEPGRQTSASDDMGATAAEGLRNALKDINNDELTKLWEELT